MFPVKETDIQTNGIRLHVTEMGAGPAILFVHGFPDTAYTWRRQMQVVAAAGYRAIAPDMRGYGQSSAPTDAALYTPFQTVGDLVGMLDALKIPQAIVVGHDWGATHAWAAAMMRPDRFKGVFCLSVPYSPRGDASTFDAMRAAGHGSDFYMFEQIRPEADQIWADAKVTIPGALYWGSGSAPAAQAWNIFDPARSLHRAPPATLPTWIEPDYLAHNIASFQRTGFHGALNYYRAVQPYFDLSPAFKGAKISVPAYFLWGKADGLVPIYALTEDKMRDRCPALKGYVGLDGIGHWVQHEAAAETGKQILGFARAVSPV
ncbi:MAG: alpha/beta hydrolase [Phenylobacterium sp.]|nr:MAG: alpha/beta hydrolase [Phenylobacterium sp.]